MAPPNLKASAAEDARPTREAISRRPRETYVSRLFQERYSVHVGNGHKGAEAFRALGQDGRLPAFFTIKDVSAIAMIGTEGLRTRRSRGLPPSWAKQSRNQVLYPRQAVCDWLADACVLLKPKT